MNDNHETIKVNLGSFFTSLLTIAFIVLKLCNVIDWSWIWVLSPFWIPIAIVLIIWMLVTVIGFFGLFFDR